MDRASDKTRFTAWSGSETADQPSLGIHGPAHTGERRLPTVLEKLLENVAFDAPGTASSHVVIDQQCVADKLTGIAAHQDISRFIP